MEDVDGDHGVEGGIGIRQASYVALDHVDRLGGSLGEQALQHRAGEVDTIVGADVRRDRQCDPPGADADLQDAAGGR